MRKNPWLVGVFAALALGAAQVAGLVECRPVVTTDALPGGPIVGLPGLEVGPSASSLSSRP